MVSKKQMAKSVGKAAVGIAANALTGTTPGMMKAATKKAATKKAGPSGHSNTTSKVRQAMNVESMAKARNTGRTIKQQAQKAAIQSAIEGATSGIAGKFREEANSRPKQLLREDKKTARVPADTMIAKKKKMY